MELIINSKKHGLFNILIDDEDFEKVSKYSWHVAYDKYIKGFYILTNICKNNEKHTVLSLHRLIMNNPKGMCVDHINHDTLDNRKCNLRVCIHGENNMNSSKRKHGITSKYKGVSWNKNGKKFVAQIKINKKVTNLGYFDNEIEAAKTYNEAAKKYYKEFANINII